jgi:hypothetical protein
MALPSQRIDHSYGPPVHEKTAAAQLLSGFALDLFVGDIGCIR